MGHGIGDLLLVSEFKITTISQLHPPKNMGNITDKDMTSNWLIAFIHCNNNLYNVFFWERNGQVV